MSDVRTLLTTAIRSFGSEAKLAQAAGVTQQSINEAKLKGRVGPRMAIAIETATGGQISKSDLRPDLWPLESPHAHLHAGGAE